METVKELAERLSDAYSTDRYSNGWSSCIRMLRKRGYNDQQIESIIRSKWTRWAGDSSNNAYGKVNSADLARFLDAGKDSAKLAADVEELTRETFA